MRPCVPPPQPTPPEPEQGAKRSLSGRFFLLRWRFHRFCATCGCLFHAAIFVLKWAAILLVLAIIWLSVWGLPRPWLNRALDELGQHGIYLRVGQARLDIFNGLAFEDVALYELPKAAQPLLAAEKLRIFFDPRDWRRGEHGIRSVSIRNGTACLILGYPHLPCLTVSNIHARLRVEGGNLRLSDWVCDTFGVSWRGHGLVRDAFTGPTVSPQKVDLAQALDPLRRQEPAWLAPVLEFRQSVVMADVPTLDFDFMLCRAASTSNIIHAVWRGNAAEFRGVRFSPWQAEVSTTGAVIQAAATVQQDQQRLVARGGINLDLPRQAWAHVYCDLPVSQVLAVLPSAWQQAYTNSGVLVHGPASMTLNLGPAPVEHLVEHIAGSCRAKNMVASGVPLPQLRLQFHRDGDAVTLTNVVAEVGEGRQRGKLDGHFALHLQTQAFSGQAHTTFDPHALFPVMGAGLSNVIALMQFNSQPPVTDVGVKGTLSDPNQLVVTGRIAATDFTFRDERVVLATSAFQEAHGVLDLPDAQVIREDGYARGHVTYNMDDDLIELDANGVASPYAVAHMIAPALEKIIRKFVFQGPVRVAVNGRVSVGPTLAGTDLHVNAEGERMGWRRLVADHASFDLLAVGAHFTFTNVHGVFCGGPFHGAADFSDVETLTNCHYTATVVLTNADFARVCDLLRPATGGSAPTNGTMTGSLIGQAHFAGSLEPWQSVTGAGEVYIHNGSIFQVRLFGGLSKLLSKIYPGLGYLSQTELHLPFTIGDGRLRSEDINIKGAVLSLTGRGEYRFNNELDFQAQLQLLRSGALAEILRAVTFPVTKLLELKLLGTLDDPRWRPLNLPKELFLQFD
ncbi:MAG: hypothetical protein EPN23_01055 [Verrucomicrobia bacterium]|nr:MAG: hypothetical protein EPN23_01055 [Verrucomicrobiota bacterium]